MIGRRLAASGLLVALAGCGAGLAAQHRYTGQLTGCGAAMAATLTRQGDSFAFVPGDSSLLIRGTVAADGSLAGVLNTQPPSKPSFLLEVSGHLTAQAATVLYTTPRCTAAATLTRRPERLLP